MANRASSSSSTAAAKVDRREDSAVSQEIKQDGKVMIRISEKDRKPVFVTPCVFRGQLYVNVREFFVEESVTDCSTTDTEGEEEEAGETLPASVPYFKATTRGVALTEAEFDKFVSSIERVQTLVKRLKRKQAKVELKNKTSPYHWQKRHRYQQTDEQSTATRRSSFL